MSKVPILQPSQFYTLDEWSNFEQPTLQGAVSTGDIWQFGLLHREHRQISQDLNLYRVPADLEDLLRILVAIILKLVLPSVVDLVPRFQSEGMDRVTNRSRNYSSSLHL